MPSISLTQDEQEQFNKEFGTNSYVSPSTVSKSVPLNEVETNQVLGEFKIKPDTNNYIPPEIRSTGEDVANKLRNSYLIAGQTSPEQAVKDVKMSNELSVPTEYFMDDSDMRDQVAEAFKNKKDSAIDWNGIVKQYPTLSQFLSDPKNMATAKDLIPELAEQDKHFQNIKQIYPGSTIGPAPKYQDTTIGSKQPSWLQTIGQMAYSGAAQFNQGMYGLGRMPIEAIFGSDNSVVKWLNQRSSESQAVIDTAEEKSKAMGTVKKFAYTGGSAAVNMVPTMLMSAMTGGAGEVAALGRQGSLLLTQLKSMLPFGVQSVGQYAEQAKQEGASLSQQVAYGLYGGSVEMVTELPFVRDYIAMTGSKEIVKAGVKNIAKEFGKAGWDFLKNTAEETVQEVITSPLTQAVKKTLYEPDMPFFGDNGVIISIPQAESDAYGAFAMTTIMHAMGLPFSSRAHQMAKAIIETGKAPSQSEVIKLNSLAQTETPHAETTVAINEAKDNAEIYKQTGEIAAKSQYLDRLPEAWRTLVEASTKDGKLENVYVDPESFVTLMQSMAPEGTDPGAIVQEVAKELGIENQLKEAVETGKPLSISYAKWLEKTAKTPIYKKLEGDIKFSEDGLTLNQAAVEEERIKKAIEDEQKQVKIQSTNRDAIYNDIKEKIVAAGRSEREAKYSAQVFASRMVAEGARRQVNPLELYMGMMQPEIRTGDNVGGQAATRSLNQESTGKAALLKEFEALSAKFDNGEELTPEEENRFEELNNFVDQMENDAENEAEREGKEEAQRFYEEDKVRSEKEFNEEVKKNPNKLFEAKGSLNGKALFVDGKLIYPKDVIDLANKYFEEDKRNRPDQVNDRGHDFLYAGLKLLEGDFNDLNSSVSSNLGIHIIKNDNTFNLRYDIDNYLKDSGKITDKQAFNMIYDAVKALKKDGFNGKLEIPELNYRGTIEDFLGEKQDENPSENQPNIEVTGNEFGENLSLGELRKSAVKFYKKELQGKSVQHPELGEIKFTSAGRDKFSSTSADARKLKVVPKLEDIIKTGRVVGEEENHKKTAHFNIKKYFFLANDVVMEGKPVTVGVTVFEDNNGNLYYNHNILDETKAKASPGSAGGTHEVRSTPPYNEAFTNLSITQTVKNFKPDVLFQGSLDGSNSSKEYLQDKDNQEARANVQINPDKSIITLFANADASSFLHESSHLFLADTFQYVRSGQADENYLKDWKTLSSWLGIKEDQDKLTTEQQEQFARGFEAYLLEGKAPSEGLRNAFSAFRRWLTRIYKSIAGLNVQLSDEVRGVMDRMLATEDEIQEREAIDGYLMAVVDQKDVTPQTWNRLEELKSKAHEMAIQRLLQPQMDELKQDYQEFLNQERERVRKVTEEEVAQLPIYRIMEVVRQNFGAQKDVKELSARYLKNDGITDEGITRFEAIAESFGYTSGDHLARSVVAARSFTDEVNDRVEMHMTQFNELKDSMDLKFEAEKAVHNEEQLEALALEKAIFLELIAASDRKELDKQHKRQWNAERAKFEAKAARRYAEKILVDKLYREASAATSYFAAERNAAVKQSQAIAKKDYDAILRYSTQRLLTHALALEAGKVKQEVDKYFRFLHKFQLRQRPKIDDAFLNQIDKILFRFKLIDNLSPKAKEDGTSLHEWIESRKESQDADIPDRIANEAFSKDYHELTLGELRDLVHAVKNISKVAWNETRLLTDGKRAEIKAVAEKLSVSIRLNNEVLYPEDLDPNVDESKDMKLNVLKYLADHKKVEFIVRALDGYKDQGMAWQYIILPIMRSMDKEYKLRREAGEKYGEIFRKHYGENVSQLATKKIHSPELAHIFTKGLTKENILTMALNWGSELNQKRLIDGYLKTEEMDEEEVGAIIERYNNSPEAKTNPLSPGEIIKKEKEKRIRLYFSSLLERTMDRNDWDFVQEVLDLVNSYWPMIVTVEKIRKGFAPEKREAKPIETPYGVYPGGYFHIAYDTRISEQAYRHSEQDNLKGLLESTYVIPSTKSGFTKATVEEVIDRPLALNLSVVDKHLSDVIHMVSFINSIRDVDRILNERSVISAISQTRGKQEYRQFREWLEAIGYEYRNPLDATEKLLQKARMGAAVVNMGLKITTAVGQLAGVFPVMQRIGSRRTVAGMLDFHSKFVTGRAGEDIKFVFDNSEMMKNRAQTFDRDIKDVTKKLIKENKYDQIQDFWFKLTGLADLGVTIPTWIQSYNLHIDRQIKSGKTMETIDKEMAVRFADQVIRETQGSGDVANMAHVQRGSEFRKILTMFYSYFSVFANQLMESGERAINRREYGQLFAFAAYWWFLPAVASELLSGRGPGDDDDDTVKWLASTILRYPLSGFVVLRDVVNALGGRFGGYELSPVGDAFQKGIELWNSTVQKGVEGKDIDWGKVGWNSFEFLGYWLRYPAKQVRTTVGNIYDLIVNDEDFYLRDLVFPKPANRR